MKPNLSIGLVSLLAATAVVSASSYAAEAEPQVVKVSLKQWEIGFKEVTVKGEKARFEIRNDGTM